MVDVSIIIVNWNTREVVQGCLTSIYEQTRDIDYEVIVVDNASTDGSAEMVKKNFPRVILIENSENRGFAAANNQGIAIAKGRYMLLLNSDTVVLDNAIAKIVSFADDNPDAAVMGCRVLNTDMTLQPTCFMFPSILNMLLSTSYLYKLFRKSKFFGRERMAWWGRNDVREVDVVTGCFMLVRRESIEQVGLMDERFFMYAEETDWCYRFKKAGYKIIFAPHAEIIHIGGESSKLAAVEMALLERGSRLLFFKKHGGYVTYALACVLIALFFLLRIPYWLIMALSSKKKKRSEYLTVVYTYIMGTWYALTGGYGLYQARPRK
jgi:hypothetical protein